MASRDYTRHTISSTQPTRYQVGDEYYDPIANLLYKCVAINGTSVTFAQVPLLSSGNLTVSSITNSGLNGTGNIGSSTSSFNTVFAKATSAQYADLAENYQADADYTPGTVLVFGGDKEVTTTTTSHDTRVAGVVSTNPAYLMNSESIGVPIALTGRVPCQVQGPVGKGTVLVTGTTPGVAQAMDHAQFQPGCVLGKALESIKTNNIETIEVVVGKH